MTPPEVMKQVEERLQVLVVSVDQASLRAGNTAWWRAGQFVDALAQRGIDLHTSGTLPPWIYPWGWTPGFAGSARKAVGVLSGVVKRVAQSFTLPKFDTVVILRDVLVFTGPPLFEELFAERANFLVFELDDAIWMCVEGAPVPPLWTSRKAEHAAANADRVIAGNDFLAEWARQYCDDVVVIPTAAGDWIQPRRGPRESGLVRVGWSGHSNGAHFLNHVMDGVEAARQRTEFELAILSRPEALEIIRPVEGLARHLVLWESPETEARLTHFDIGLMPLDDSEFAKGKCAFKLIRYMAAGLPVVASPVGMNSEVVVEGETGFLASTPQEWADAIVALVDDAELRERMGRAGRERYEANYSPAAVMPRYAAAITPPPGWRARHADTRGGWRSRMGRPRGKPG
ncbi:MAG: glycosyltransferase family 4 protein [Acidimicrobiia bacterium]